MLKKILSATLSIMIVASLAVFNANATETGAISVETVSVEQGTTEVDVKINIENNPGVTYAKLKVTFGSELTLINVTDGGILGNSTHSNNMTSPYNLYWNNSTAKEDFTGTGIAATLTFEIPEDLEEGTYPITVSVVQHSTFNYDDEDVVFSTKNGSINITVREEESPFSFSGAQIRTSGVQGLRFIFEISKEAYALLSESQLPDDESDTGVGFGTVLLPRKLLGDAPLTKETADAAIIPAVKIYNELENSILFTACMTGTLPKNYNQEYVAVPYLTYLDSTGEEVTIYGEETTNVTIYNIAYLAYKDPTSSTSLKNYLYNNILSVVNPDYER